eukprot:TRINITY_DN143_c0_g1_i13.p2 TRINITY_DN143_c0_g1~~TRINITY_DN143_c0_g1_i13.p2  ORF type:complete len:123 (-),score=30.42 TRINITY_DN143_c0_g1_i13:89-457(-)
MMLVGQNLVRRLLLLRECSLTEPVLCATWHVLQVATAAGAGGLPPQGLAAPVVSANLSCGVPASSAGLLLNMVGATPTPSAECVGCLLYTSDAADDLLCVDLGGRRIIKKKKKHKLLCSTYD